MMIGKKLGSDVVVGCCKLERRQKAAHGTIQQHAENVFMAVKERIFGKKEKAVD